MSKEKMITKKPGKFNAFVAFQKEDHIDRARELAELLEKVDRIKAVVSENAKAAREDIQEMSPYIKKLQVEVKNGGTYKEINVTEVYDWDKGQLSIVADSGEVLDEYPIPEGINPSMF